MSAPSVWSCNGRRIYIQEVGPRDGLQMEKVFVPTAQKLDFINALSATGVAKVEVTAFVSPTAIPALADAQEVMQGIARPEGVVMTCLVPTSKVRNGRLPAGPVSSISSCPSAKPTICAICACCASSRLPACSP